MSVATKQVQYSEPRPVVLRYLKQPDETVCINEYRPIINPKTGQETNRRALQWTERVVKFNNTVAVVSDPDELAQVRATLSPLYEEPDEGPEWVDERTGLRTRNEQFYRDWMNSEWREQELATRRG